MTTKRVSPLCIQRWWVWPIFIFMMVIYILFYYDYKVCLVTLSLLLIRHCSRYITRIHVSFPPVYRKWMIFDLPSYRIRNGSVFWRAIFDTLFPTLSLRRRPGADTLYTKSFRIVASGTSQVINPTSAQLRFLFFVAFVGSLPFSRLTSHKDLSLHSGWIA